MKKLTLAIVAASLAALAWPAAATAAEMTLKAQPRVYALPAKGPCWWEPSAYYRDYPYFPHYPYNDVQLRPGCHNAYYAPRWSGFHWNIWNGAAVSPAPILRRAY